MELHPVFRQEWVNDNRGYEPTSDLLGYSVSDAKGQIIAFGESKEEAWENALEVQWPSSRENEGGMSAGAVVAR